MLPRNIRLKKQSAFKATYNVRNSVSDGFFIVFAGKKKKNETQLTKFGFVVSKKNHKRAVKRNRLKRLMRESVRTAIKENQISNTEAFMSIIIMARDKAIGKNYKEIKSSILKLLLSLKIK